MQAYMLYVQVGLQSDRSARLVAEDYVGIED